MVGRQPQLGTCDLSLGGGGVIVVADTAWWGNWREARVGGGVEEGDERRPEKGAKGAGGGGVRAGRGGRGEGAGVRAWGGE